MSYRVENLRDDLFSTLHNWNKQRGTLHNWNKQRGKSFFDFFFQILRSKNDVLYLPRSGTIRKSSNKFVQKCKDTFVVLIMGGIHIFRSCFVWTVENATQTPWIDLKFVLPSKFWVGCDARFSFSDFFLSLWWTFCECTFLKMLTFCSF